MMITNKDEKLVEIIKNRFYFLSDNQPPKLSKNKFYFSIDKVFKYHPFFSDFGPLNISDVITYIKEIKKLLSDPEKKNFIIYHYTDLFSAHRLNSSFLVGCFMIFDLKLNPKIILDKFANLKPKLISYRDASYNNCTYDCTLSDCLNSFYFCLKKNYFNFYNFDKKSYNFYRKMHNGDITWILPKKLLAFSSPSSTTSNSEGIKLMTVSDYIPIFKKMKIKTIIRLNKKTYNQNNFIKNGFQFIDLYFPDGSIPSKKIVQKFLEISKIKNNTIAIHCKAGLGRTGTLIGCYLIKEMGFNAREAISWIRILRPGSVIGRQQHFLVKFEKFLGDLECQGFLEEIGEEKGFCNEGQGEFLVNSRMGGVN